MLGCATAPFWMEFRAVRSRVRGRVRDEAARPAAEAQGGDVECGRIGRIQRIGTLRRIGRRGLRQGQEAQGCARVGDEGGFAGSGGRGPRRPQEPQAWGRFGEGWRDLER
jgi:hypothetical protein